MTAIASHVTGVTPIGDAREYYPGLGKDQNKFNLSNTEGGFSLLYEKHLSVSPSEEFGVNLLGYNIVNVAQKLELSYSSKSGDLSISASTDLFPSATLKMNGNTIMQYDQPSFEENFSFKIKNNHLVREYLPARWFIRL